MKVCLCRVILDPSNTNQLQICCVHERLQKGWVCQCAAIEAGILHGNLHWQMLPTGSVGTCEGNPIPIACDTRREDMQADACHAAEYSDLPVISTREPDSN